MGIMNKKQDFSQDVNNFIKNRFRTTKKFNKEKTLVFLF